ncbi:MAG TPA: ATP-binding protein [Clostridia bacterium]|nr:ATP-binding protein [Clostridia bacterium]
MHKKYRLEEEQLTNLCDIEDLSFETTEDLQLLEGIIGQERGADALTFGLKIKKMGYNIYVAGIGGVGKSSYTCSITEQFAGKLPVPYDWVYVYNFKDDNEPRALCLEPGIAKHFKSDIEGMVEKLRKAIPEAFGRIEYETKKNEMFRGFHQKRQEIVQQLNEKSKSLGFMFTSTDRGIMSMPLKEGKPMSQKEYLSLSREETDKIMERSSQLNMETFDLIKEVRELEEQFSGDIKQLERDVVYDIVNHDINGLCKKYGNRKYNTEHINDLEKDIMENLDYFKSKGKPQIDPDERTQFAGMTIQQSQDFFNRYNVNVFVDNSELQHAPVIEESNPTFNNILGTIEYKNYLGMLKTDFMQIKPGALHLANGGFLVLQIRGILNNPLAWEVLKRALSTKKISIENLNKQMGYLVPSTIKPEAIPLNTKVILIGDYYTYNILYNYDDDFRKLFKVMVDFDTEMNREPENIYKIAQFIATHNRREGLKHLDRYAVARVIEYSSRLAGDQHKLSARFNRVIEILYEADLWAEEEGSAVIGERHIQKAISEKVYRNNKYEEKLKEMFSDGSLLIDLEGKKVGQINGLAVISAGEHSFGKPTRITASTYSGESGIINIEREANQSGRIHDKGVLILSGYLGEKYAKLQPLGLTVSIGFEQSYSFIEGDSASSTELYAILSGISEVPVKQYIAVTGSVNQKGEVQPIGGVNEKIEGFFEICKLNGLTGKQGVIIPKQNVKNLMLKSEVIDAVKNNEFHIYAVGHVDEGIEILTDMEVGTLDKNGEYPDNTINGLITKKLKEMNRTKKKNGSA